MLPSTAKKLPKLFSALLISLFTLSGYPAFSAESVGTAVAGNSIEKSVLHEIVSQLEVPRTVDVTYTSDVLEGENKKSVRVLTRIVNDLISGKSRVETLAQLDSKSAIYRLRTWNGSRDQMLEVILPLKKDGKFPEVILGPSNGYINPHPAIPDSPILTLLTLGDRRNEILNALSAGKLDQKLDLFRIYIQPNKNIGFNPANGQLQRVWASIFNSKTGKAELFKSIDIKRAFNVGDRLCPAELDSFESGAGGGVDVNSKIVVDEKSFHLNTKLDDKIFELIFPVGCLVQDNISGKTTRVDGTGATDFTEENIVNHLDNLLRESSQ